MLRRSLLRRYSTEGSFHASELVFIGSRANLAPNLPPVHELGFGNHFTNHMLTCEWTAAGGWDKPIIEDYKALTLPAQCGALHYGLQNFEGLKAYLDPKGEPVLFRPDMNAARQIDSNKRLAFPTYDPKEWVDCVRAFVRQEKAFIPSEPGFSLYLRPTTIAINENLRVGAADKVLWFVIASPVGPYYPEGFKPISLKVEVESVRAFPGGTGGAKIGGNYGPTIAPGLAAMRQGFSQILWLNPNGTIDEVGAMNFLVFWKNESGEDELITAPLDGTILPGVTRDSVLSLARQWGDFKVSEKRFHIDELTRAIDEKRVYEMFGCGTAAVVSPVKSLNYRGKDYSVEVEGDTIGPLAGRFWKTLQQIQTGQIDHEWCVRA